MSNREQSYGLLVFDKAGNSVFSAGLGSSTGVVEKILKEADQEKGKSRELRLTVNNVSPQSPRYQKSSVRLLFRSAQLRTH